MAFGLTDDIRKVLSANDGLADGHINPTNLEKLKFQKGLEIPDNLLIYRDQASADAAIDKITEEATLYAQSTRVVQEYTHLVGEAEKFHKAMRALRSKVASLEMTVEQAYGEWQTLIHKLNTTKRQTGLLHASEVEEANIGFAKFERGLTEKLRSRTDESRSGSEAGSVRRRRFKLAA
ncbi:MAG: hypothetical protein AAF959_11975 [Cyanobacteria bacterium P01_D01_bin.56]